jgi:hypothetical protein
MPYSGNKRNQELTAYVYQIPKTGFHCSIESKKLDVCCADPLSLMRSLYPWAQGSKVELVAEIPEHEKNHHPGIRSIPEGLLPKMQEEYNRIRRARTPRRVAQQIARTLHVF